MSDVEDDHFKKRRLRCKRIAALVCAAVVLILSPIVLTYYLINPLMPIDACFYNASALPTDGTELWIDKCRLPLERERVCGSWEMKDAVVQGGQYIRGDGDCRMVPVFDSGADSVWLHRSIWWNRLCAITASDAWEPGPGNPARRSDGVKEMPVRVATPREVGILTKDRRIVIPKVLTKGLWGHVADDSAVCPWMPWMIVVPLRLRPMVTEFYVRR